jgi:ankyrin repeat protein
LDNKRKKVDVNQKCGINMHTPMHFAIEMNSPRILSKLLAQEGILLNQLNKDGLTPLDYANHIGATE